MDAPNRPFTLIADQFSTTDKAGLSPAIHRLFLTQHFHREMADRGVTPSLNRVGGEKSAGNYMRLRIFFSDCELLHTCFPIAKVFYGVWTDKPPIWEMSITDRSRSFAVGHHSTGEIRCQVQQDPNKAAIYRSWLQKVRSLCRICTPRLMKPSGLS